MLRAQNIKLSGVVKDSLGAPLEMANVIAYKKDSTMVGYSITNNKGLFQFSVPSGQAYTVRATYLGMVTGVKETQVLNADTTLEFVLKPDANALDAVELTYEMPVQIKGDTIVYNTDSFTDGSERKLGDIVNKLPGMEVDDDGEIQVEGKKVSKVFVDGKEFFSGDSKLANQNIPANAVSKVEVLRNFNEVSQVRGLNNAEDQIAINIKLKEGKDKFWFGEVEGALGDGGSDTRYLFQPRLFYYSPKTSINVIGDLNNIGKQAFTRRDYFRFTGGFQSRTRNSGATFSAANTDIGFAGLQNNQALNIETRFGAANVAWNPNKKWSISGFGVVSDNETDLLTNTDRTFISTEVRETTSERVRQKETLGLIKLAADYKPSEKLFVEYDMFSRISDQREFSDLLSNRLNIEEAISQNQSQQPFSIQQNANAYYTLDDKNVFALELQHVYQEEDPFFRSIREEIPFPGVFTQIDDSTNPPTQIFDPLENASLFDLNQTRKINTSVFDAKLDYWYVLNKKSNLNFTAGTVLSHQRFKSGLFQILDNGAINPFEDDSFNNNVSYNYTDNYLGVHYKFITGIFTISPGLSYHNFIMNDRQLGVENRRSFDEILPDFFVRAQFRNTEYLTFTYRMSTEFTDIDRLAQGFLFTNYNSLYRGNNQLENALFDNYNLNYFNFNLFNFTTIIANLSYNVRRDAFRNITTIEDITNISSPINSNFNDETVNFFGSFQRSFGKIQARVNTNLSYSKFNNIVNDTRQVSENFNQNYGISSNSRFKKGPNFDVGYNLSIADNNAGAVSNIFYTHTPRISLDYQFLNGFLLKSSYRYNFFNDKLNTIENEFDFLDAELMYKKKDSPWEYKVSINNILNTESISRDTFNQNFISSSQYFVLPRYVMFHIRYEL